jgi:hypothetical protein
VGRKDGVIDRMMEMNWDTINGNPECEVKKIGLYGSVWEISLPN